jgi:hypothetical protein
MIILPSEFNSDSKKSSTPTVSPIADRYYPSFDPSAMDGFYSIFNRPYTSNYSYSGRPEDGDNYRPKARTKNPVDVFMGAMNGDGGSGNSGFGQRDSSGMPDFGFSNVSTSAPASASPNNGFDENGNFQTDVGSLSVAAMGPGYSRGIGGIIGMVNDAIGMIGALTSGSDNSDASNADAGYNGGMGGYDSSGYDSPGTGSSDPGGSSDSSDSGDGSDSGDSGDSGDGDSGGSDW